MRPNPVILLILCAGACGSSSLRGPDGGDNGACSAVLELDRSCATSADCIAVSHTVNCCGQEQVFGLRASEQTRFAALEAQCGATYPACGCAAQQPYTDDGSRLQFQDAAGVTCVNGQCTTFVTDCGRPCDTGTTCFSCANGPTLFAACTTACTDSTSCQDPTLPLCQTGSSGNVYGMYCTASNVTCDTP